MTEGNSSFSSAVPGLQLGIDSTSLGAAKTCFYKYKLSIIDGWTPKQESRHLTFGLRMHEGAEEYQKAKSGGKSHDEALGEALNHVLLATWNPALKRPWSSDDRTKNRFTLLRTLVYYLDSRENDVLQTITLPGGKLGVELSFSFDSGLRSRLTGEEIVFCGHLDRIATLNGEPYIIDIKTTGGQLSQRFFAQFSPNNQFSMYMLAGQIAFSTPVKGLIVDGIQVTPTSSEFERGLIPRSKESLEEWLRDAGQWIKWMEDCAESGVWPQNDKACDLYGGCEFREVCSRSPVARDQWLRSNFTKRTWDPMKNRGDI